MNIGENIRKLRKDKKLTLKDLGIRVGLSEQAIGQYERGDRSPSIETLIKILSALNLSQEEIYKFINSIYSNLLNQKTDTTEKALLVAQEYKSWGESFRNELNHVVTSPKYLLNTILEYLENTEEYYSSIFVDMLNSKDDKLPYFTDEQINNIISKVTDLVKYEIYKLEGE